MPKSGEIMKQSTNQPVDGPHEEFFTGGKLSAEGRFRKGKRHGNWKSYL
jgi:antitoxin component YwqK of YwqJK toxin-antitoxin module